LSQDENPEIRATGRRGQAFLTAGAGFIIGPRQTDFPGRRGQGL
jgi:hypothetical protein